ncbi:MAG: methyltransferase domain-containing protein [Candidatus Bathyarchaeia archaeon]|jgi:SAM-dependent methyltransferase
MNNENKLKLNLGCGNDTYGDIRLDLFPTKGANVVGDSQRLPFKDSMFTEVYERNLFEHLPNPAQHLHEIRRVMKINGTLTIITDNAACLKYYILGTHTGGYRKHGGKDRHFALFTEEHMRNFMDLCGFKIDELRLIDTDYCTRFFDRVVRLFAPSLSFPRILVKAVKVESSN